MVTIAFGLSTNLWLSLGLLVLLGACDNISVVLRGTLVQVLTPDAMRGRVSALNGLFIGTSNELGAFESGTVAQFFGPGRVGGVRRHRDAPRRARHDEGVPRADQSRAAGSAAGLAKRTPNCQRRNLPTLEAYGAGRSTRKLGVGRRRLAELGVAGQRRRYGSSRIQMLRKLIGALGSPCDCSLIGDGPCALYDGWPM